LSEIGEEIWSVDLSRGFGGVWKWVFIKGRKWGEMRTGDIDGERDNRAAGILRDEEEDCGVESA
jgi:hypothetical protein